MAKNNRVCVNCGRKYRFCPSCGADRDKPSWYSIYCSENCRTLFDSATDYFSGILSKEKAEKIVSSADLTRKNKMSKGVNRFISEVFPQPIRTTTPALSKEVSEEVKEEIKRELEEENKIVEEVLPSFTYTPEAKEVEPLPEDSVKTVNPVSKVQFNADLSASDNKEKNGKKKNQRKRTNGNKRMTRKNDVDSEVN